MKGFELLGLPIIIQIHLISLVLCSALSVWVLKHLVTPIMRSLLWHVCCSFSPLMWIQVYLTCVYVSQVWCASWVSESALQLQGKPALAPFCLLTRLFLRIEYLDYLPDIAWWYLYEAFPPKSTTTLAHLYEDPLLVIYFGILISSWPSFY